VAVVRAYRAAIDATGVDPVGLRFLIDIGDRSVGGQIVRDQRVGPWQVPVADAAMTASGFWGYTGEAMAMGKPVVAFGHGALPEIVLDGETGLLVAPGDTNALASSVSRLLRDPIESRKMGRAGRQRVDDHFRIERTVAGLDTLYQELLKAG